MFNHRFSFVVLTASIRVPVPFVIRCKDLQCMLHESFRFASSDQLLYCKFQVTKNDAPGHKKGQESLTFKKDGTRFWTFLGC